MVMCIHKSGKQEITAEVDLRSFGVGGRREPLALDICHAGTTDAQRGLNSLSWPQRASSMGKSRRAFRFGFGTGNCTNRGAAFAQMQDVDRGETVGFQQPI